MNEPLDVEGVWWLPESPDHKVPGWFRYDQDNGGHLRLAGSLRPLNWIDNELADGTVQRFIGRRPDQDKIYPRIHGQAGHRLFNLEDAFQLSLSDGICREDDAFESVHVNWLITGAWFVGDYRPEVHQAVVELQHLTAWSDNDALMVNWDDVPPDVFAQATATRIPTESADIGGGLEMALAQALSTGGDQRNEATLQQRVLLRISSREPTSMDNLTDRVADFQDLLTIASGKVANIQRFHFTHADVPKRSLAGKPLGNWQDELELHTRWSNQDSDNERLSPYGMVFTLEQFGGIAGLRRWMSIADQYRSELRRILATRYNAGMFLEDRVAHCVAALESFDRTRRNSKDGDTYLVERLRLCVAHAGSPFEDLLAGESVAAWTQRAKNHRNALGHHLDRYRSNLDLVEGELADQLLWLGQLCLLRSAEAPEPVFERIRNNSHFRWVAKRVAARREEAALSTWPDSPAL